ncbi:Uncharacterised protein [uncultured Clostridium sp.]|nr:Uncharacterised protein [uncultured Clostridium sp.]
MPDRTQSFRKKLCLTEQKLNLIQHKMRQMGTYNFGAYVSKMLIDGGTSSRWITLGEKAG